MEYKYTGIILNKRDVGETDRIYTIYTLEGGKIKSLAKGVRKPHAKLAASLENCTLADITIVRSQGLGKITGSIIEQNFAALKQDYDALLEVFSAFHTFDRMVDFEHPDEAICNLLREYLETMERCAIENQQDKFILLRLGFLIKLLDLLGYTFEMNVCANCASSLSTEGNRFSASHGGAICADCGQHVGASLPMHVHAVKLIRLFLQNNINALTKIKISEKDCNGVVIIVDDFLRWVA